MFERLRNQLSALGTELASLPERIGRSSHNSSKSPPSDAPGFKPQEHGNGSGRKRGGKPGHPGSGPAPLPIERVDEVVEHHPDACRRCGLLLDGEDPDPLCHEVIEIPPSTLLVIDHRRHRLVCPCCSTTSTGALTGNAVHAFFGEAVGNNPNGKRGWQWVGYGTSESPADVERQRQTFLQRFPLLHGQLILLLLSCIQPKTCPPVRRTLASWWPKCVVPPGCSADEWV